MAHNVIAENVLDGEIASNDVCAAQKGGGSGGNFQTVVETMHKYLQSLPQEQ